MAALNSNSRLADGSFTNEGPGQPLDSAEGGGKSRPDCRTGAASWMAAWRPWLVRLFFCAGLAAAVLVLEPLAWRLGEGSRSARPAPEGRRALVQPAAPPRQNSVIEADMGSEEGGPAVPDRVLGADEAERTTNPGQAKRTDVLPAPLEAAQADQLFEQRLGASEEDLRARLRDIPEVRLLSDDAVKQVRGAEEAAGKKLVESARVAREAARVKADAANARVNASRAALAGNRRDPWLVSAERQAVSAARVVQRAFIEANSAYNQAVLRLPQERDKIGYEHSLRFYRTLKQAAVREGLPLQSGPACQLTPSTAAQVEKLSKDLRSLGFAFRPGVPSTVRSPSGGVTLGGRRVRLPNGRNLSASDLAAADEVARTVTKVQAAFRDQQAKAIEDWLDHNRVEKLRGTVPTLTQILQVEDEAKRLLLVRELTRVPGAAATKQLAVRAIADLSPAVRQAAVAGLGKRPWQQYGPVLLRGLRYPWSPVADHAAVALRALKPPEAVASLVDLLDLPSPSAPVLDARTKKYTVCELVRLNHLRNCLLCHAPSAGKEDGLVRGLIPTPGEPLPSLYYESQHGLFVRADRTYLHQDFSIILPDKDAGRWPSQQRYDFVVRRRTLLPSQVTDPPAPSSYPQRDAVLYALRGLTGKDGGDSTARWRELLSLSAEKRKGDEKRPALEGSIVPLADPVRPR